MMLRSLGLASEVMVLGPSAQTEWTDEALVLRTPAEPSYWFGNCLILRSGVVRPAHQIAAFHSAFPGAAHVVLQWDDPAMRPGPEFDPLRDRGFEIQAVDVLTLRGPVRRAPLAGGYVIRPLVSDLDWRLSADLHHEIGVTEDDHDPVLHRAFVEARVASHRRAVALGRAQWFAAFRGEELAAQMGVYVDGRTARYQSVETRASHRRRGLCAALVAATRDWAGQASPRATPVIIALADEPPGRIYRSCGFVPAETLVSALLRPPRA